MKKIFEAQIVPIDRLQPNEGQIPNVPKNPRLIKNARFKELVKSIKDHPEMMGLREVIAFEVAGALVVIAGNMRLKACIAAGEQEVPVKVLPPHTSPETLRAIAIKDNIGFGEDDMELLALEWDVEELRGFGLKLPGGFGESEAADDGFVMPNEVTTDIQLGDIFELTQDGVHHRLICGIPTDQAVVNALLAGAKPQLMVTDPPYGVNYDPEWRKNAGLQEGGAYGTVTNDHTASWRGAYNLFPGAVAYIWHADRHARCTAEDLEAVGYDIISQIIWNKSHLVISRGDYHWKHEPCWYAVKRGKKHNWKGGRKQSTVWDIDKPMKSETGHSTQKPVECMAKPIRNNSSPGDSVYDPFVGSGTTMVAAQSTGRNSFCIELSPQYCQVTIDRMVRAFPGIEIKRL